MPERMKEQRGVGISAFKTMTYKTLRELDKVLLVEEFNGKPVAAVIPYQEYLEMQSIIINAHRLVEGCEP